MAKPRDAAFIVDPRRQLPASMTAPHVKKDSGRKKAPKSKAAASAHASHRSASKKAAQSSTAQHPTGASTTSQNCALPASRPTVKQARQSDLDTKIISRSDKKVVDKKVAAGLSQASDLRLKSRNHRLFLAPNAMRLENPQQNQPSWARNRRISAEQSITQRLHSEIEEYAKYTKRTVDAMTVSIEAMIGQVRKCVESLWSRAQVETFGSYSTGIWLPSSDVDLVILNVVEVEEDKRAIVANLRQLAQVLGHEAWVASITVLETAKIPVLKLVSTDSSIPIDITFESSSTHSGLLARDLVKQYAEELPELYPLAVVFKQLLRERDLNDAYTGGLSSYSIVLMLIHFSLIWRHGPGCYEAASIYAAGLPTPMPSDLLARMKRRSHEAGTNVEVTETASVNGDGQNDDARGSAGKDSAGNKTKESTSAKAVAPEKSTSSSCNVPPPILSSFAAVVSNATSSSAKGSTGIGMDKAGPLNPPSYAAVASGKAKVVDEPRSNRPTAPPSYAAAVASSKTSSTSVVPSADTTKTAVKGSQATRDRSKPASSSAQQVAKKVTSIADVQLDLVSISSSTAETEDCSSCSSSTSVSSERSIGAFPEELAEDKSESPAETVVCLGEHTIRILEFYGILFDYRRNGLSIRDGGYIYRLADHISDVVKPALVIEDPIHPDRNVSASSFAFSRVVTVFEDAFYALKYYRPSRFAPSVLSCLLNSSGHTSHSTIPQSRLGGGNNAKKLAQLS